MSSSLEMRANNLYLPIRSSLVDLENHTNIHRATNLISWNYRAIRVMENWQSGLFDSLPEINLHYQALGEQCPGGPDQGSATGGDCDAIFCQARN